LIISLNPDDPGVFGYIGATPDYYFSVVSLKLGNTTTINL